MSAPDDAAGDPTAGDGRTDALDALAALAGEVATRAAAVLVDGLRRERTAVATKSSSTDMVTEMDRAAEQLIAQGILAARPDDGLVGEEGTSRDGTSGVRWIIDPLDGTTNYLYGHAGFAVSVAAARGDEVLAGVVVDPLHGDTFAATRGRGATRNGAPVHCSAADDLATALVATGFSYDPARRGRQARVLAEVLPRIRDIRRMGAAAVDLCSVACGRVDAFWEKGLQPWDHAAGALIAAEAGARVGDLDGGPPSTAFTLAAPAALFDELAALLRAAGAADA
ncbi:MAG: inositol monophosphatase family protein [Acidimicrobiales bacterium]